MAAESSAPSVPQLPAEALVQCPDLPWRRIGSGKVRDLFTDGEYLLLVASDRISAFDVVLNQGIPGKGVLLTQISLLGFAASGAVLPNHLVPGADARLADLYAAFPELRGRSMLGRRLEIIPVECVVRGHLAGSGWKSYRETGYVQGIRLAAGLREGDRLEKPIFTPTTKAAAGHDQPLTHAEAAALLGDARFQELEAASLAVFEAGRRWGEASGLILADTKFEFGRDPAGTLTLADEVFTPDSSRWWDAATFTPGSSPPGFDKQFVRDFLAGCQGWDYQAPAPDLPSEVISGTQARYFEAWHRLAAGSVR